MKFLVIILSWLLIAASLPCYAWHLAADPQPMWNAFNNGVMWYEVDVDGTVYTHNTQPSVRAVDQGDETVRLKFSLSHIPFGSGPYIVKVRARNPVQDSDWVEISFTRDVDGNFIGTTGMGPNNPGCFAILP